MEIILIAVPFFFLLIVIELITDWRKGTGYYRFNDAINSLNLGVLSRLTGILKLLLPLSAYYWVYQHYALWQWESSSVWLWLTAFIVYDLGYYWVHRLSHEMAIMWGSHVVHHSSEEYNLTTALRQTSTPAIFAWLIFLPMALAGVPPEVTLACGSLNLIYQFWVHTRHINKLPRWFETVFVTPSHHRVHHALNKEYIDKNYAGVFIIWDRIFGTFMPEHPDIPVVYGVSDQLHSWNPVWANAKVYKNLLQDLWHTKGIPNKLKTLLMPPGWRAEDVAEAFPRNYASSETIQKYDVSLDNKMKGYLLVQFATVVALVFSLLLQIGTFAVWLSVGLSLFAVCHCWVISGLQERKSWVHIAEPLRLITTAILLLWITDFAQDTTVLLAGLIYTALNLLAFYTIFRVKAANWAQDASDIRQV